MLRRILLLSLALCCALPLCGLKERYPNALGHSVAAAEILPWFF